MGQDFGDVGNFVADVTTMGYTAGQRGARAAGDAAKANLAQQQGDRALALSFAEATPEELAQLNRSIALNEQDITRKEKLLASSDPALIEAGSQALQLLKGEEAKTLGPLRAQFEQQETELRSKLAAQLGPGYENTTAGIQALEAFNQQRNSVYANAQQNALGALLGVAQNTSGRYGTQENIGNAANLSNLFGNIQKRQIAALTGAPITAAGAPFIQSAAQAAANQQFIGRGIELGTAILTGGASAGAGGLGDLFAGGTPSSGGAGTTIFDESTGFGGSGGGSRGFAANPYG